MFFSGKNKINVRGMRISDHFFVEGENISASRILPLYFLLPRKCKHTFGEDVRNMGTFAYALNWREKKTM